MQATFTYQFSPSGCFYQYPNGEVSILMPYDEYASVRGEGSDLVFRSADVSLRVFLPPHVVQAMVHAYEEAIQRDPASGKH